MHVAKGTNDDRDFGSEFQIRGVTAGNRRDDGVQSRNSQQTVSAHDVICVALRVKTGTLADTAGRPRRTERRP